MTAGNVPPLPRGIWGQLVTGFEAFSHLFRSSPKIDPSEANAGEDNSIVAITINWMATSWGLTEPQIGTKTGAQFTPMAIDHPYIKVLQKPNPWSDAHDLNISLLWDYICRGNAYELLVRNRRGEIVESYWLPVEYVRPIPDQNGHLSHYEYLPSKIFPIRPEDMIHHKFRPDRRNPLQGISPLAEQYREIVTDNAYSDYGGGLAKEGGVPPIMFAPRIVRTADGQTTVTMSPDQAKALTDRLTEKMSREPGKPRFVPGSVEMHQMGFKPDEMALLETRAMPECRIPAALGIDPITLGLYTGMKSANYSNKVEANRQSWRNGLLPVLRKFEEARTMQALRTYPGAENLWVRYDTSQIPELMPVATDPMGKPQNNLIPGTPATPGATA